MSEKPGRYQRSVSGMVGALIVLVVLVVALVAVRNLLQEEPTNTVEPVDYRKAAEVGQEQVGFPILAPASLPEGWRATSVRLTPEPAPAWHLGLLTAEERYVGLEQSRRTEERMVEVFVDRDAVKGDPVQVDGETWQTWSDEGGDTAITRVDDGVTVLVVGTPDLEVLTDFAATLG